MLKPIIALSTAFVFFGLANARAERALDVTPPMLGDPLPGLQAGDLNYFFAGLGRFTEVDSVLGTEPGATDTGLGPRFNLNSCAGCHAYPAPGGTSPVSNPAIAVATEYGATNKVPYFLLPNGPLREARFKYNPDGTRDGSVHNNFVITGRKDAVGCDIQQPDFEREGARGNLSFRIPTQLFGAGLIQAIPDGVILANKNSQLPQKRAFGIRGHENRSGNDGTITRFGWKAQNKSMAVFAGEAYNVEQGVTNELFPNERDDTPGCMFNGTPEDRINPNATDPTVAMSDVEGFTQFGTLLAPPQQAALTPTIQLGARQFVSVGCALCHTPQLETGLANPAVLSNQPVALYSDLLVHNMGTNLADDIVQGLAGPSDFRTAPLWGIGHRLFFLHDGRATDLNSAIQEHASLDHHSSEADLVIERFNQLPLNDRSAIIDFLQSL